MNRMSLWGDEACMIYLCRETPADIIEALASADRPDVDVAPPLFFILLNAWMHLLGSSIFAFRGFSVLFGVLTVWGVVQLGEHLFSKKTGCLAGIFAAIHPFQIWYSQEGRMYTLAGCLAVYTILFLSRALRCPTQYSAWIPFAITGIALAYTQYYGLLLLFALFLHAVLAIRKMDADRKRAASCFAGVVIFWIAAFLPWTPVLLRDYMHAGAPGGFPLMFNWVVTPVFLFAKAVMFGLEMYIRDYLWLYPLPMILAALSVGTAMARWREPPVRLLMFSVVIPFLIVYGGSLAGLRVYKSHPFVIFHPAFLVLMASGSFLLKQTVRRFTIGILIAAQITVLITLVLGGNYVKPRVQDIVDWIDARSGDRSTVAVCPAFIPNPLPIVGDLLAFRYHSQDRMNTLYLTGSRSQELVESIRKHGSASDQLYFVYQDNDEVRPIVDDVIMELNQVWKREETALFPSKNRGFSMAVIRYGVRALQNNQ
ncbi:glycosyltransferase family 39 protein [bacterium]|nr:glycosyltransferase family 39 protein [candidate division CSSED10-310 bacterium]